MYCLLISQHIKFWNHRDFQESLSNLLTNTEEAEIFIFPKKSLELKQSFDIFFLFLFLSTAFYFSVSFPAILDIDYNTAETNKSNRENQ